MCSLYSIETNIPPAVNKKKIPLADPQAALGCLSWTTAGQGAATHAQNTLITEPSWLALCPSFISHKQRAASRIQPACNTAISLLSFVQFKNILHYWT